MSHDLILAKLDHCQKLLAECKTAEQAKRIAAVAEAARVYAKRVGAGLKVVNLATTYRLRAERRLGEILQQTEKARGARKPGAHKVGRHGKLTRGAAGEPREETLADAGISKKVSARAQRLATVPAETFEAKMAEAEASDKEVSATRMFTREVRTAFRRQKEAAALPDGQFRVLYADPPWKYNDSGLDEYGHAERHYPPLSIEQLCALPIKDLAQEDAVLFLWTTAPMLEAAFLVVKAWGFTYKTNAVWDKVRHNFGHYFSLRHEHLLICTRGSCTPDNPKLHDSVVTVERSRKHSEKPEEFRSMIETMYPSGPRVELFARSEHDGWETWGNEA